MSIDVKLQFAKRLSGFEEMQPYLSDSTTSLPPLIVLSQKMEL